VEFSGLKLTLTLGIEREHVWFSLTLETLMLIAYKQT